MNKKFNIEQEMDGIFKESLENAMSQVPPGVWESVSSSIGSAATGAAATAGTAAKTAMWMKAAIASLTVAAVASVSYFVVNKDKENPSAKATNTTSISETKDHVVLEENIEKPTVVIVPENTIGYDSKEDFEKESFGESSENYSKPESLPSNPVDSTPKNIRNPMNVFEPKGDKAEENKQMTDPTTASKEETQSMPEKESNETENEGAKVAQSDAMPSKDSSSIICPNVITPNGDGKNDCYEVILVNEESFLIQIYDLEMNKLYESTNKYKKWCCEMPNGGVAPSGRYLVIIKYRYRGKADESKSFWLEVIK